MGVKLSQIGKKQREALVEYDDEIIAIVYRPGKFTPRVEAKLNEAQEQGKVSQRVAQVLSEALISWDVLDDDGKPLTPNVDLMMDLPLSFLTAITSAIGEDLRPNEVSA